MESLVDCVSSGTINITTMHTKQKKKNVQYKVHPPYSIDSQLALQCYTLKSKLFSVYHCKAVNRAWEYCHSVPICIVGPHNGTHSVASRL